MTTADDRDEQLARLIAAGRTYAAAGAEVGLSESSVYRRMRDEGFRARVDGHRGARVDEVVAALIDASLDAADMLAAVVGDAHAPLSTRVKAASDVLTQLSRWIGYEKVRPPHPPKPMTREEQRAATRKAAEDAERHLRDLLDGQAAAHFPP